MTTASPYNAARRKSQAPLVCWPAWALPRFETFPAGNATVRVHKSGFTDPVPGWAESMRAKGDA